MLKLLYKLVFVCYTVCSVKLSFSLEINNTGVCKFPGGDETWELQCCQNYKLHPNGKECIDCPNGTYSVNCIEKCLRNYYGFRCQSKCNCFANETCNKATGCEKIYTNNLSFNSTKDYLCSKVIAGGAVTFSAIIIFLLGIIFIQRRKLANASYTTLTVRRDQNNYNEVPHEMSDSITGQYYEMSAASETHAPTVQQNINQIQHIDTSGYLIPSGMLETSGDYQTIAD